MITFGRMLDVFKTFLQTLQDEVERAGGYAEMLERLGKKELRPAVRQLAEAVVGSASAKTSSSQPPPIPTFDPGKARQAWASAECWKNPDRTYWMFTMLNEKNQTKLRVNIGSWPEGVKVEIDRVTLDCPPLHYFQPLGHSVEDQNEKPHHLISRMILDTRMIVGIEYNMEKSM